MSFGDERRSSIIVGQFNTLFPDEDIGNSPSASNPDGDVRFYTQKFRLAQIAKSYVASGVCPRSLGTHQRYLIRRADRVLDLAMSVHTAPYSTIMDLWERL
jgi:hypothetical protein